MSPEIRFGAWVRNARQAANWSQTKLGEEMGRFGLHLHPTAITRMERGQRPTSLNEAAALAEIFGTSLDEMIADPDARTLRQRVAALEARLAQLEGGAS